MNASDVIDDTSRMPADLVPVIAALAQVGRSLCRTIKRGPLGGALGEGVGENLGGDQQKALDVMADAAFAEALATTPVRYYACSRTLRHHARIGLICGCCSFSDGRSKRRISPVTLSVRESSSRPPSRS